MIQKCNSEGITGTIIGYFSLEEECAVSSCTSMLESKNMDLHRSLKKLNAVFNKLDTITSLLAAQSKF
jgi:protein phosphatase 1 regulatory subunit 21